MKKQSISRSVKWLSLGLLVSLQAFSVSVNFGGNFRSEGDYFTNITQGFNNDSSKKQFIRGRFLVNPNFIIDDHFSVRSEWSLLESQKITPNNSSSNGTTPLGNGMGMGGFVFGDPQTTGLVLNRAWLEWGSDFGVVRLGRMPFSWGYGLMWDAGGVWDDFGTTLDRLEYRLHLGHIVGALAYSKPKKNSVWGNNDADFFGFYLQYDNPEADVEGGIIYEKQTRANKQGVDALTASTASTYFPAGPLASKAPIPVNNNVVDVYLRKTVSYFTLGGEVNWMTGKANDYGNLGQNADLEALAATFNVSYEYHRLKAFVEFLYASGDSNLNNDKLTGFVSLNPNRRAGFILGRELIGKYSSVDNPTGKAGNGSMVVYGNDNSYSGVYFVRPGVRLDWSPTLASGLEVVYAQKASVQPGEERSLGTEIDFGTDYSVYKNFDIGANVGVLFPGKGLLSAMGTTVGRNNIFGFRTTASLKF